MEKQSIDKCLAEYSPKELIEFHANLNALHLCCSQDFHLFPLLMQVHFAIATRARANNTLCKKYLAGINELLKIEE